MVLCLDSHYLKFSKSILILDYRKATGLERDKIKEEHEIMERIKGLQEILSNEDLRYSLLADDLREMKEKYGDEEDLILNTHLQK